MGAKTPERKEAATAKRRDTRRARPIEELHREVEATGYHLQWVHGKKATRHRPLTEDNRLDLEELGWILRLAAEFVTPYRQTEETLVALRGVKRALASIRHGGAGLPRGLSLGNAVPLGRGDWMAVPVDESGREMLDAELARREAMHVECERQVRELERRVSERVQAAELAARTVPPGTIDFAAKRAERLARRP